MNIRVRNLDYDIKEDELKDVFSKFGEISSIKIVKNKISGQPKCSAFVEMPNSPEADKAIQALNESELKGRNIKVDQAKQRDDKPQQRFSLNRPQGRFGSDHQQGRQSGNRSQQRRDVYRPQRKPGL